jgi:hypothetical protein
MLPNRISAHRLLVAGLVAAGAVAFSGGGPAGAAGILPTLYVNYTMGCNFGLTDDSGKPVTSIAPGTYNVLVATPVAFGDIDLSGVNGLMACQGSAHFALTGPGVSLATTLDDGDSDHIMLQGNFQPSGTYVAWDSTPGSSAKITFATTATGTPVSPSAPYSTTGSGKSDTGTTPTASAPSVLPLRGALTATVSAAGKVTLELGGKPVGSLRSGKYLITVYDQSKKSGFVVQELHRLATAVTTAGFTGKRSTSVILTKGSWVFYPSFVGTKRSFTVS